MQPKESSSTSPLLIEPTGRDLGRRQQWAINPINLRLELSTRSKATLHMSEVALDEKSNKTLLNNADRKPRSAAS
jgi:hypothetical protein